MEFVQFEDSYSGVMKEKGNSIRKLESYLFSNVSNFKRYYSSKGLKYDNKHYLRRLTSVLANFTGSTPSKTYENIKDNLRYITGQFGIGYLGSKQFKVDLLLGCDLVAYKEYPVNFNNLGELDTNYSPIRLYKHNLNSLQLDTYLFTMDEFSLIGLDIPLFGAVMHQERLNSITEGITPNTNKALLECVIFNILEDALNLAIINKLKLELSESNDEPDRTSNTKTLPYSSHDLDSLFNRELDGYINYLNDLKGLSLGDVYNNLPLPYSTNLTIDINDYYSNELMWYNAFSEVSILSDIEYFSTRLNLKVDTSTNRRRLKRILSKRNLDNYTKHLDNESKTFIYTHING